MEELTKKRRGRPSKVSTVEKTSILTPYQERAKKAWITRRSKKAEKLQALSPNQEKGKKVIFEDCISIKDIKSAIKTAKVDISVALKRLTDMGLCVVGVGIKSVDKDLKYDSITIKFQI